MSDLLPTRLRALQAAREAGDLSALDSFWSDVKAHGAPLIERTAQGTCRVTFVWRGDGSTRGVDIIQDWGADGIREHSMSRLPSTDVWHYTREMPSDTRTTYQLAPDPLPASHAGGVPFIPDPLNPNRFSPYFEESGFQIWFSLLSLPDAPSLDWLTSDAPSGAVTLHTPFEDGRRIWMYTPHTAAPPYSMLVVFDGRLAMDVLSVPRMLDVRIADRAMRPTMALFVDNIDRRELACDPEFAEYVARKVVPWAQSQFPVSQDPARTVVCGSSLGGLCAAYLGLRYPDVFGAVLSQTGWFRWMPEGDREHEWLARAFIEQPTQPVRFYLDVGLLETAQMLDGGPSQLVANRHMRDVLRAKGYDVTYREYSGGHDYSSIQNPLFEALPLLLA